MISISSSLFSYPIAIYPSKWYNKLDVTSGRVFAQRENITATLWFRQFRETRLVIVRILWFINRLQQVQGILYRLLCENEQILNVDPPEAPPLHHPPPPPPPPLNCRAPPSGLARPRADTHFVDSLMSWVKLAWLLLIEWRLMRSK